MRGYTYIFFERIDGSYVAFFDLGNDQTAELDAWTSEKRARRTAAALTVRLRVAVEG